MIFLGPITAEVDKKAPWGFFWAGVGVALIGVGGIVLAFLTAGSQLLFFSQREMVMTLSFTYGFTTDLTAE